MPICVNHNQSYNSDEYCVYCGQPQTYTGTTSNPYTGIPNIININDYKKQIKEIIERKNKFIVTLEGSVNYLSPED